MSERDRERTERVRRALREWDTAECCADLGEPRLPEERVARMRATVLEAGVEHARGRRRSGDDAALAAGWSAAERPRGRRLALALAVTAGVLLIALLGVLRSNRGDERSRPGAGDAPVVAEAVPSREESSEIGARPEPGARRAGGDVGLGAEAAVPVEQSPAEPEPIERIPVRTIDPGRPADRVAGVTEDDADRRSDGNASAAAEWLASTDATRAVRSPDPARNGGESPGVPGATLTAPVAVAALDAGARGGAPSGAGSETGSRRIRRLDFETPSGRKIHWILDSEFRGVAGR